MFSEESERRFRLKFLLVTKQSKIMMVSKLVVFFPHYVLDYASAFYLSDFRKASYPFWRVLFILFPSFKIICDALSMTGLRLQQIYYDMRKQ